MVKDACDAYASTLDEYCEETDVTMCFVAYPEPPLPTAPGCWAWAPSGCIPHPSHYSALSWTNSAAHNSALDTQAACTAWGSTLDLYCGEDDVVMHFVP